MLSKVDKKSWVKYTGTKKERRVHVIFNIIIAWPGILKMGQIDVLFIVTRLKMKGLVTFNDSFEDIMLYFIISLKTIFIGYPVFLFRPNIYISHLVMLISQTQIKGTCN